MRIRPLSETLANQIAAGEVIERPASVLKELVENSLDAGAGHVSVDVERGGVGLVRVRDDGEGIHPDDLVLSLERHATSKLSRFEDLAGIRTMGFRGEALPSIASVSRFELTSRARGRDDAYTVKLDGGAGAGEPAPASRAPGTSVSVRDLFFNTPARRRFLRTEKTELRHVEQLLKRLALARFDVRFALAHDGRALFDVRPAASERAQAERVARFCGRAFADASQYLDVDVDVDGGGMRLRGWVAGPQGSRPHADLQHFYVNGRSVRDGLARHALRQAFQDLTPAGRHPAYVLYLDLDPGAVDVNVHPTKHEVRFRESRLVHDFLSRSVRRAMTDTCAFEGADTTGAGAQAHAFGYVPPPSAAALAESGRFYAAAAPARTSALRDPAADRPPQPGQGLGPALGCTPGGHVVCRHGDGFAVIGLGMARAALALARFRAGDAAAFTGRPLLIPEAGSFDGAACDAIEQRAGELAAIGLDVRRTGSGRLSLRAAPAALAGASPAALLGAAVEVCAAQAPGRGAPGESLLQALLGRVDLAAGSQRGSDDLDALLSALARHGCRPDPDGRRLTLSGGPVVGRVLDDDALEGWLSNGAPVD